MGSARAQFVQSQAGTFLYSDTANWLGGLAGNINGHFEQTAVGPQIVTFAANQTLGSGLSFQMGGTTPNLTLQSAGSGEVTLTLVGNVTVDSSANASVFIGSSLTQDKLSLALSSGGHTVDVAGGNTLMLLNTVSGSASLTKTGGGLLYLAGDNTYSGGTTISSGAVFATNSSGSATGAGAVNIANGAVLFIGANPSATTGFVSGNIANDGEVAFSRGDTVSYSGAISGAGSVTQLGEGTLVLTGSNTYTGGTTVSAGTLRVGSNGALPTDGTVTVNAAALLDVASNQKLAGLTGAGNVTIGAGKSLTYGYEPEDANGLAYSTLSGVISGDGILAVEGNGTLELTGTNTYFGGTKLKGGTLVVSDNSGLGAAFGNVSFDGGKLQAAGNITSGRALELMVGGGKIDDGGNTLNFSEIVFGTGALTKTGTGTLALSASNTYTGGTTVLGGTLAIGSNANLGHADGVLTLDGGTLKTTASFGNFSREISLGDYNGWIDTNGFDSTFAGKLTGNGEFIKTGSGVLTLTGNQSDFTGHTNIYGGTLALGATDTLPTSTVLYSTAAGNLHVAAEQTIGLLLGTGTIALDAGTTLTVAGGNSGTYSGNISGQGGLMVAGDSYLELDGENTYLGGTTVQAGSTLGVGAGANAGSITGDILNDGSVVFGREGNLTYAGSISGGGNLVFSTGGNYTLTGNNTYAGWTLVEGPSTLVVGASDTLPVGTLLGISGAGTLKVDHDQTVLRLAGTSDSQIVVGGNSTLTVNPEAYSGSDFSGVISGSGSFTKSGAGYLYLLGNNTFTGNTSVLGGELLIGNGNYDGRGALAGNVSVADRAVLTFFRDNSYTFAHDISGAGSVSVQGSGMLNLTGNNTYSGGTFVNSGATIALTSDTHLGDAGSTVTLSGGMLRTMETLAGFNRSLNLDYYGGIVHTNGFDSTFGGAITGQGALSKNGDGILTLTGTGSDFSGGTMIYGGTLRLGADDTLPTAGGVTTTFNSTLDVASNQTVSYLQGDGAVALATNKTLTVSGGSSYFGGSTGGGGKLQLADGAFMEATGDLAHTGGTVIGSTFGSTVLAIGNNEENGSLAGDVVNYGELRFGRAGVHSFSGNVSGPGNFSVINGALTITGNHTYTGDTLLSGESTLVIGAANTLPAASALYLSDYAQLNVAHSQTVARLASPHQDTSVLLGSGSTLNVNIADGEDYAEFLGSITGAGQLEKSGPGFLSLLGPSNHTGGTNVSGGGLVVGDSSTASLSGVVNVGSGAALILRNSGAFTFDGSVTGTGSLNIEGTGVHTLTGNNTQSGGTQVGYATTLAVANDANIGGAGGVLSLNGGTLRTLAALPDFNRQIEIGYYNAFIDTNGFDSTFSGIITGIADFAKTGAGTLTITGQSNSYTGRAYIEQGTLRLGATDTLPATGDIYLTMNGTLDVAANQTVSGFNGYGFTTLAAGKTLTLSYGGTYGGEISGAGALALGPSAYLRLENQNTYTGGTTIGTYATLVIGEGTDGEDTFYGSLAGPVANSGGLTFSRTGSLTYAGDVSGSGQVTFEGGGQFSLTGHSTYSGGTSVYAGTLLTIASHDALPTAGDVAVNDDGAILLNRNQTVNLLTSSSAEAGVAVSAEYALTVSPEHVEDSGTFAGTISGLGTVIKDGPGQWTLAGDNSYTGGTEIRAGALRIGNGNSYEPAGSIAGDVAISAGAKLVINRPDTFAFNGSITGAGSVYLENSGLITLGGTNTHTGGTFVDYAVVLSFLSADNLGAGPVTLLGGTLRTLSGLSNLNRDLVISSQGGAIDSAGFDSALSGQISGDGDLTKLGGGILSLTGSAAELNGGVAVNEGILRLGADNVLAADGAAFVDSVGTLEFAGNQTLARISGSGAVVLNAGKTLALAGYYAESFDGTISGAGSLAVTDGAVLRLGGENTYSGGTSIDSNSHLIVGDGESGGSVVGAVLNDGHVAFDTAGNSTFSGSISGNGSVTFEGSGTLHLTGASTYTGPSSIYDGSTLSVDSSNAIPVATDLTLYSSATLDLHADQTVRTLSGFSTSQVTLASGAILTVNPPTSTGTSFDGLISGAGSLVKSGEGFLYLNHQNTYTGGTTVAGGQLILNGGILGPVAVEEGAVLAFQPPGDYTFSGAISGAGGISAATSGAVTLDGNNTYTGGTLINYGAAVVAATSDSLGASSSPVVFYGGILRTGAAIADFAHNLVLDTYSGEIDTNGFNSVFSGRITGNGGLTKSGDGVLTLTNSTSDFTGWTYVKAGTLQVGATNALPVDGGVNVEGGATLDVAHGIVVGALSGPGDIVIGTGQTLTKNGYNYDGFNGTISGGGALAVAPDSTLTFTGTATHTGGTVNDGSLRIGDGNTTGTLAGDIVNHGLLTFWRTDTYSLSNTISGTGDVAIASGNVTLTGGSSYSGRTDVFAGAHLTLGQAGALPAGTTLGLQTGATLDVNFNQIIARLEAWNSDTQITLASGATFTVSHSDDYTVSSLLGPVAGSGELAFTGGGTLILGSPSTHTGGTTVTAGRLQFESTGSVTGGIMLAADARVVFNRTDNFDFSGVISGDGGIDIIGGGAVRLSGHNTYSGPTHLNWGLLEIGTANALPISTDLHLQSATLAVEQDQTVAGLHGYGTVSLASGRTLTVDAPDQSYSAFDGHITGSGALTKTGLGYLALNGLNDFTGSLTLSTGNLKLDLTTGGSLPAGNIADNGTLEIWTDNSTTYAGVITGSGHLGKGGYGTLTLTADSPFSGTVSVGAGRLQLGDGGTSGSLSTSDVYLTADATLAFNRSDSVAFSASISGDGALVKEGTGTLTLMIGSHLGSGATIASGTLVVGANGALSHSHVNVYGGATFQVSADTIISFLYGAGTTTIDAGKTLTLEGTQLIAAPVNGSGALAIEGDITVATDLAYTGGTAVSSYGNLILGNGGPAGSVVGTIHLADGDSRVTFARSGNFTQTGAVTGDGDLVQNGYGTLTLAGANTYTGSTLVQTGTLADAGANSYSADSVHYVASGATLRLNYSHALAGLMDAQPGFGGLVSLGNATTLTVAGSGVYTFSGAIEGAGSLVKDGTGTLILAGANSYTGTTTITSGMLMLGSGGAAGSVAGGVTNNGTLLFNRSDTFTFSGTISGTGSVQQGVMANEFMSATTGTTILAGTNTYSGGTVVNSGTLIVGSAGALGTGSVSLNGGALRLAPGVALSNALDFGADGGTLAGNGTIAIPITAGPKITLSPGESPGTLTFANSLTWAGGGAYTVEIASATGNTPGVSFDTMVVSGGTFAITANSATPFNVRLASLDLSFNAGMVSDFNPANTYSWQIASSATPITGFSASAFTIDKSSFLNPIGDGQFFVTLGGAGGNSAIYLNFTPVPEPSTWALLLTGLAAVALYVRRRRA